jgi:hypothetical protein
VFDVHADAATVFENFPPDALIRRLEDHIHSSLLSRPPYVGGFASQGGLVEISTCHLSPICPVNYILHLFLHRAKILAHVELITEHTEKWAPPTFLLVIRSIRSNRHG